MDAFDAKRLSALEDENAKLKRPLAEADVGRGRAARSAGGDQSCSQWQARLPTSRACDGSGEKERDARRRLQLDRCCMEHLRAGYWPLSEGGPQPSPEAALRHVVRGASLLLHDLAPGVALRRPDGEIG